MLKVAVPSFSLDIDTPVVLRVAVVVEGLSADGSDWAQVYAPGMEAYELEDMFRQGLNMARQSLEGCGDQ